MCGRYASILTPDALAAFFRTVNPLPNLRASYNFAPTQQGPVVRRHPQSGARHLDALTWGLVPHFCTDLKTAPRPTNARAEGIATTPMFRAAYAARRCIVPASAFYEWQTLPAPAGAKPARPAKQPWAIARTDGAPLAFAGIWESLRLADGEVLRTYAIVTTAATGEMTRLHHRVPVVLEEADFPLWLGETAADPAPLLRAPAEGVLRFWPVSTAVNSVRNDHAALLDPLPAEMRTIACLT